MTASARSMSPLIVLLVALGFGCAAEVDAGDASPVAATRGALAEGDGAIHPGCHAFREQCRDGNAPNPACFLFHGVESFRHCDDGAGA